MKAAHQFSLAGRGVLSRSRRFLRLVIIASLAAWTSDAHPVFAVSPDHVTCYFPLAVDHQISEHAGVLDPPAVRLPVPEQIDSSAWISEDQWRAWRSYLRLWQAHRKNPDQPTIRRYLGLSARGGPPIRRRPARVAPAGLNWRPGSFRLLHSPHFQVFTQADDADARRVIEDLENTYWVWTQLFFPLWNQRDRVAATFVDLGENEVAEHLRRRSTRLATGPRMTIVLFASARDYQRTLAGSVPGIQQSTGFYSDTIRTMFLYSDEQDDPATRRHELTHQLILEATASRLANQRPGADSHFWLVEGIAGYMESLHFGAETATVGGWHAPRLQFARHRVFTGRDFLPPRDFWEEGIAGVQGRDDLARWYAHAIMQTHWLLDGPRASDTRGWLLHRLADIYRVDLDGEPPETPELTLATLQDFLSIDDAHLRQNPIDQQLASLCLAGCAVTAKGLAAIPPQSETTWLGLSGAKVGTDGLRRLVPDPSRLIQLNLERTDIDDGLSPWLAKIDGLRELDLSFTDVGDSIQTCFSDRLALETLWLTGTRVGDAAFHAAAKLPHLVAIDVQRTRVTPPAIDAFRARRPTVRINPLELRSAPKETP